LQKTIIPFNRPHTVGKEIEYISQTLIKGHLSGDGHFTNLCQKWLESEIKSCKALLTQSCTNALEMTAILLNLKLGDEIIMPSYTFVSTANAFVLRGAIPVFVDIRKDTLNLDESLVEAAITPRTRAIVAVHYAGVPCEMDTLIAIAKKYDLFIIEDAAQGIMSYYKNRPLGSIGHLAAYSFHETKNIISGEGGALLINDPTFKVQAEIIREKGTDRSQFFRGEIDKYTWQNIGSSFLPSELTAAFLWAQLEEARKITEQRLEIWGKYNTLMAPLEDNNLIRRPIIPSNSKHNGHMYYILLKNKNIRIRVEKFMKKNCINVATHYVALHSSPAGKIYSKSSTKDLTITEDLSGRILRMPMWLGLSDDQIYQITDTLKRAIIS
jgi:dTDP-4-amino-4,6-dideoxygalactose transaminase